jgi:hypothetical protein
LAVGQWKVYFAEVESYTLIPKDLSCFVLTKYELYKQYMPIEVLKHKKSGVDRRRIWKEFISDPLLPIGKWNPFSVERAIVSGTWSD